MHQDVIQFWFHETAPALWWKAEPAFDDLIRSRFLDVMKPAQQGELHEWRDEPQGRLAEIIVLDQFSRNVYRNTPGAFAHDPMALVLAQEALRVQAHKALSPVERSFLLLPFMHSESKRIHVLAEALYLEFAPASNYEFELKHKAVIDRFGRYPSRNKILDRVSSEEEIDFLKAHGPGF